MSEITSQKHRQDLQPLTHFSSDIMMQSKVRFPSIKGKSLLFSHAYLTSVPLVCFTVTHFTDSSSLNCVFHFCSVLHRLHSFIIFLFSILTSRICLKVVLFIHFFCLAKHIVFLLSQQYTPHSSFWFNKYLK